MPGGQPRGGATTTDATWLGGHAIRFTAGPHGAGTVWGWLYPVVAKGTLDRGGQYGVSKIPLDAG
jgi:hypothetical protein